MYKQDTVPQSARYFSMFEKNGYYNTDAVYLNAGGPGSEILRMLPPVIEAATSHRMQKELEGLAHIFQYGIEEGHWQFRSFLATFLSEEYGQFVDCRYLFLTSGASSGLWLILSCLFSPGTPVFVEDPTYNLALGIFRDLKMNIVPVKTDDSGMMMDDLEAKLKFYCPNESSSNKFPVDAMIYVIPVFHNPIGTILPDSRCQQLVSLAREYNATVVCDDVYNLLHYDNLKIAPKRLISYDLPNDERMGNVISNGSFSKILAPGFRIGWLEASEWVIKKLSNFGVLQSGGGLNTYTSGLITSMLALGKLNTHLEKTRIIYKTQMEAVAELLEEELPKDCKLISCAKGGYFLWIKLPETIDASHLLPFCHKEYQVHFTPGSKFSPTNSFSNYLRVCISFYSIDVLLSAVRRLCLAIAAYKEKADENPMFWKDYQ